MARTSKKKPKAAVNSKAEKRYSVGVYARLSVDAGERKKESIETQIELAKAFIKSQSDMVLFDCYSDIGKTGTSFEREGFKRMMRDVRMRKIDCIIVKDLSRFGRNHIEAGNYIEKIFPFMGVRFIAVTEQFDSLNVSGQNEMLGVNLKNLVNEMYARDISLKVKSQRKVNWEQGSFTGGIAPYGYRAEWIGDKKCLFPEETTSDIVRKIFERFLSGKNRNEIVAWLYEERILRPSDYHKTGQVYCPKGERFQQWSRESVKMILTNPVYIGCLVQGRGCGNDFRMRSRQAENDGAWSVKEHTHEPLVREEMFFQAAAKLKKSAEACKKDRDFKTVFSDEDLFAELLFCGDCGTKMQRSSASKPFASGKNERSCRYNCPKVNRIDDEKCVTKSISSQTLTKLVKEAVRQEFALSAMRPKQLVESNHLEAKRQKEAWQQEMLWQQRKIENLKKLESEQYLKYRMGEQNEEAFKHRKEAYDKKLLSCQKRCAEITEKLRTIDSETMQKNHVLRALVKGDAKTKLPAEVVRTLISRIEVYGDHRVKVIFRFKRSEMR